MSFEFISFELNETVFFSNLRYSFLRLLLSTKNDNVLNFTD